MDKTVPGGSAPEEVTRESLIAISYCEPETALSSKRSSGKLSSEKLNLVEGKESDGEEKYRTELISISFLESPDIGSVPVGELKGLSSSIFLIFRAKLWLLAVSKSHFNL